MNVDYDVIKCWRNLLLGDELRELRRKLRRSGVADAEFVWDPKFSQVQAAQNRFLLSYWRDNATDGLPGTEIVAPSAMRPALGFIAIAEPLPDGDVLYRLFGSRLSAVSNMELTGKRVSQQPTPGSLIQAKLAVYQAVKDRQQPIVWSSRSAIGNYVAVWERLILPLRDGDARVVRFLVCNVPFGANGDVLTQ